MMKHYRNTDGVPFFLSEEEASENSQGLVEITKEEADALFITSNPNLVEMDKIEALTKKLSQSDFKFSLDYDKTTGKEWEQLKEDRQAWREELRLLLP